MTKTLFQRLSVAQKLCLSFLLVILVGSFLLSLPIMHSPQAPETSYLDHLFTAVSMVCVTGLSVIPIVHVYNLLGQLIAMILIQIGGLGLVTLIAISYFSLNRKLSLSNLTTLQHSLSLNSSHQLKTYLFSVYKLTFIMEIICSGILMIDFIPRFGVSNGIFNAIFLAISAFCNAGFDNLGISSLLDYQLNPLVIITIGFLIFAGSFGFATWIDLIHRLREYLISKPKSLKIVSKKLKPQTQLVIMTTTIIIFVGTSVTWLLEKNNPNTLAKLPLFNQFLTSLFQTITLRTAGFTTIDFTDLNPATHFLFIVQMIIGGAPGSTAAGIKLTALATMFLLFRAELRGSHQVSFRQRSIRPEVIRQVLAILIFFFTTYSIGFFLLLIVEPNHPPFALLFETTSALATSGISLNITPELNTWGRLIIMVLMFIGRVGPITVLLSLIQQSKRPMQYAYADISIG